MLVLFFCISLTYSRITSDYATEYSPCTRTGTFLWMGFVFEKKMSNPLICFQNVFLLVSGLFVSFDRICVPMFETTSLHNPINVQIPYGITSKETLCTSADFQVFRLWSSFFQCPFASIIFAFKSLKHCLQQLHVTCEHIWGLHWVLLSLMWFHWFRRFWYEWDVLRIGH